MATDIDITIRSVGRGTQGRSTEQRVEAIQSERKTQEGLAGF